MKFTRQSWTSNQNLLVLHDILISAVEAKQIYNPFTQEARVGIWQKLFCQNVPSSATLDLSSLQCAPIRINPAEY